MSNTLVSRLVWSWHIMLRSLDLLVPKAVSLIPSHAIAIMLWRGAFFPDGSPFWGNVPPVKVEWGGGWVGWGGVGVGSVGSGEAFGVGGCGRWIMLLLVFLGFSGFCDCSFRPCFNLVDRLEKTYSTDFYASVAYTSGAEVLGPIPTEGRLAICRLWQGRCTAVLSRRRGNECGAPLPPRQRCYPTATHRVKPAWPTGPWKQWKYGSLDICFFKRLPLFVPRAVFSWAPSHTNAKHTSFNCFLGLTLDTSCCEGKICLVPKAVFSWVPGHTNNAKHTSFNVFLEFAAKVGFIGPKKQCFHQFQAKLLPNAQLVRKGWVVPAPRKRLRKGFPRNPLGAYFRILYLGGPSK